MRVLHVIPAVAPRYGGPSRAVFEMCRAVRDLGVEIELATTDADGPDRLPVEVGIRSDYQGVPTTFFRRRLSQTFGYSRALARWLDGNVKRFDAVHIHAVFSHPCLAAARACQSSGVPYIVRPLGSLDPWSMSQKPWRKRLMWRLGVGRMLKCAAAVHYTTAEECRLAESSLRIGRGVTIPLGVSTADPCPDEGGTSFKQRHPELGGGNYVLALSRLHPKKNLESLIKAFIVLTGQAEFASWRLALAGDGEAEYVAGLKHLASGSGGRIVFTGWLSGEAKAEALCEASFLALPSKQENFGLCVVEALAYGTPVVVSRHVNLAAEIESVGAGWVTGLEASELEPALGEAMSDAGERLRRGQAGRDFVLNNLTWRKIAAELCGFYDIVAGKDSNGRTGRDRADGPSRAARI